MAIILASASPRREELLNQVGCTFSIVKSDIIEDNTAAIPPVELAVLQAKAKAVDVAGKSAPYDIVIGADTIVVLDEQVYGKPSDASDAYRMLKSLSGKEHQVITAIAIARGSDVWTDYAATLVKMKDISDEEISKYIATGEPLDKAGAYAIQGIGALFIEGISGCYANVVGLPLVTLDKLMRDKLGVDLI